MEYIKTYNKEEKEIYDICCSDKVDYNRIDYLLKNGASANAVEITKYDNQEENEEDLLMVQCWLDGQFNRRFDEEGKQIETDPDFCIKLLKIFIDNGLDVDRYVNHIFSDIQFTYDDKNYIEMTKLILNHLKSKDSIDLESTLSGIGTEESYNNCCTQDHKYANILSTIYEMIEKFCKNDVNPNKFFECDKVLDQKIQKIKIFCKDIKIDQPKCFICDYIDIFIECEKDILCIANKYIFVNNNEIMSEYDPLQETSSVTKDNVFGHSFQDYVQNEKIIEISFKDCPINSAPRTTIHTTMITIKLTNNKLIKIKTDETATFMKIILN